MHEEDYLDSLAIEAEDIKDDDYAYLDENSTNYHSDYWLCRKKR